MERETQELCWDNDTTEYLELFLRNLLLNEENELHNRVMHISGKFVIPPKANDESIKADIEMQKANDEINLLKK